MSSFPINIKIYVLNETKGINLLERSEKYIIIVLWKQ